MMGDIRAIEAGKYNKILAEALKSVKELKAPEWISFVKTGTSKKRPTTEKDFWYIDTIATGGLKPDFSFLVDLKPKVGLARKNKERVLTRFEKEKLNFHQKVRVGFNRFYKKLVKKDCWQKLNGALPPEKLHEQVLRKLLEKKFLS